MFLFVKIYSLGIEVTLTTAHSVVVYAFSEHKVFTVRNMHSFHISSDFLVLPRFW